MYAKAIIEGRSRLPSLLSSLPTLIVNFCRRISKTRTHLGLIATGDMTTNNPMITNSPATIINPVTTKNQVKKGQIGGDIETR